MKSSLISRDVIADSTELTVRGHCYDALVGVAGCDKSLPGLMMAMVRLMFQVFLFTVDQFYQEDLMVKM